jgi:hypothetical protein
MNKSDQDKAKKGAEALESFFEQFGDPDSYNKLVLEILFEEMNNYESLPLPDQKGQVESEDSSPSEVQAEDTNPSEKG